jgi:F-type H+-transporting ATPase subunit delta
MVVHKYSIAIFLAAKKNKKENKVLRDLELLGEIFKKFHKEIVLMNDPVYSDRIRLDFVQKLSNKNRFDKLTVNLLRVLSVKKRFNLIEEIARRFHDIRHTMDGIEKVEVVSISPLTSKQTDSIEEFFKKNFKKKIWISSTIDPSIIGGIMIKMGSVMFDNSLLNKIGRLKIFIEQGIFTEQ